MREGEYISWDGLYGVRIPGGGGGEGGPTQKRDRQTYEAW